MIYYGIVFLLVIVAFIILPAIFDKMPLHTDDHGWKFPPPPEGWNPKTGKVDEE
jgi:hypothetical protein